MLFKQIQEITTSPEYNNPNNITTIQSNPKTLLRCQFCQQKKKKKKLKSPVNFAKFVNLIYYLLAISSSDLFANQKEKEVENQNGNLRQHNPDSGVEAQINSRSSLDSSLDKNKHKSSHH